MKARDAAARAVPELRAAGVADPEFEAELLIRTAGALSRSSYFAGAELLPGQCAELEALIGRRSAREPFAYICGRREFFGLDIETTPAVLIPRPESELLVEIVVDAARSARPSVVADIGTGSGCIAIAIARALPGTTVVGSDLSAAALAVARRNAAWHGLDVQIVRADLATALTTADIVVANLPYIPTADIEDLEPEVRLWEPRGALDGGGDGLDLVRRLLYDCAHRLKPRLLALEVGIGQSATVAMLGRQAGAHATVIRDLAGIERVVCLRWA